MPTGRTLLLSVDGLDERDHPTVVAAVGPALSAAAPLRILPGGPSEPAPALASLVTGTSVARTGVATEHPFEPESAGSCTPWSARSMAVPTLFDAAHGAGLVTAALQWPATAGADIDLCLPLVEDVGHYRNRWEMTAATSSPRMTAEHLAPRREAGVQLSQVPPDALVAEIAADCCRGGRVDLLAARLTGLGIARRADGLGSRGADRALLDTADVLQQLVSAFSPGRADRVLLVPGRPLVPTRLLVHPNTALAAHGLIGVDGPRVEGFRALVWPDGPRGVLHVRREEGPALREAAVDALAEVTDHTLLQLRRVDDGVGASAGTDVIAVLEGTPGTVFGLSATHRPLVDGDDPYYAGPRAVTDPSAAALALGQGPGLPVAASEGSWADLGVTLARAMGLDLPGASARGLAGSVPTAS